MNKQAGLLLALIIGIAPLNATQNTITQERLIKGFTAGCKALMARKGLQIEKIEATTTQFDGDVIVRCTATYRPITITNPNLMPKKESAEEEEEPTLFHLTSLDFIPYAASSNVKMTTNTKAAPGAIFVQKDAHSRVADKVIQQKTATATFSNPLSFFEEVIANGGKVEAAIVKNLLIMLKLSDINEIVNSKEFENDSTAKGNTLLGMAIMNNADPLVYCLLTAGADVHKKNLINQSPLELAVLHGTSNMVALLLRFKADIQTTNAAGETMRQIAQRLNKTSIVQAFDDFTRQG